MNKNFRFLLGALAISATVFVTSCGDDDDDNGTPAVPPAERLTRVVKGEINTQTWDEDTVYLLDGFVYVKPGQTLTIQPGTIVKGKDKADGSTGEAGALIIQAGAKIVAEGTKEKPIIFTAEIDNLASETDLDHTKRNLWGGVILLGKAPAYSKGKESGIQIEGVSSSNEPRAHYGGTNAADNSGVLKYVSIRHTGEAIGAGDEIQGLSLGGVGSGTTLEYIEIFGSGDDGIEIFGGTCNLKYVTIIGAEDDDLDFDLGWRGKVQFLLTIKENGTTANHCGEWDGADPDAAPLYAAPVLYNCTFIGAGNLAGSSNSPALLIRDAAAPKVVNSIFVDYPKYGIEIEDLDSAKGVDSYERMTKGELEIKNNIWFASRASLNVIDSVVFPTKATSPNDPKGTKIKEKLLASKNSIVDPKLGGISRTISSKGLDPVPTAAEVSADVFTATDAFFMPAAYKGAFEPGKTAWVKGWTLLDKAGYLK